MNEYKIGLFAILMVATTSSAQECKEYIRSDGYYADICATVERGPESVSISEISFNEKPLLKKRTYAKNLCKIFGAEKLKEFSSRLVPQTIDMDNHTRLYFSMRPAPGPALDVVTCQP